MLRLCFGLLALAAWLALALAFPAGAHAQGAWTHSGPVHAPEKPDYPEAPEGGPAFMPSPNTLGVFYAGRRRSQMEPCGCRSKQEGGIQYEATVLDRAAAAGPILKLDAGEWTDLRIELNPFQALKTSYVLRALHMLDYDAVNVGLTDLQLTPDYMKTYREKYPQAQPNLISANVFWSDRPAERIWPASRIVKRRIEGREVAIAITGATGMQNSDPIRRQDAPTTDGEDLLIGRTRVRPAIKVLDAVLKELRPKANLLVVLWAGDQPGALELARAYPEIDYIIMNGRIGEPSVNMAIEGSVRILRVQNFNGREIGYARLAPDPAGKWMPQGPPQYLPMNKTIPPKQELVALIDEFKKSTRMLGVKLPDPVSVKRIYAGAMRCQGCHASQHQDWQQTRHAHALRSLVDKDQQFNPECLPCHVTGFRQDNGFYTANTSLHPMSSQMMNVQCEMCHGPGYEHTETQERIIAGAVNWMKPDEYQALLKRSKEVIPTKAVAAATCTKCHQGDHDPNFNYAEKVKRVNHAGGK